MWEWDFEALMPVIQSVVAPYEIFVAIMAGVFVGSTIVYILIKRLR